MKALFFPSVNGKALPIHELTEEVTREDVTRLQEYLKDHEQIEYIHIVDEDENVQIAITNEEVREF